MWNFMIFFRSALGTRKKEKPTKTEQRVRRNRRGDED